MKATIVTCDFVPEQELEIKLTPEQAQTAARAKSYYDEAINCGFTQDEAAEYATLRMADEQ